MHVPAQVYTVQNVTGCSETAHACDHTEQIIRNSLNLNDLVLKSLTNKVYIVILTNMEMDAPSH
jgi:hypothetical protein